MHSRRLALMLVATMLVLLSLFLLSYQVYVGMSTAVVAPLCEGNSTCAADEVCCFFPDASGGVCGQPDLCDQVVGLHEEQALAFEEQAHSSDIYIYYLPLFALSVMFAVVVYIYFK